MNVRFAPRAAADSGEYLEHLAADGGEMVAMRESARVLGELIRLADLDVTGRRVQIEGVSDAVHRWVVKPFVVYYVRNQDLVVLRVFHARRRPIER